MATTSPRPQLSDEQLGEFFGLLGAADTAELKLTIPESDHRPTIAALGIDPLQAQIRQVFFFDTPDLRLDSAGVVVRARRVQGRPNDSVVKLRPLVPDTLSRKRRRSSSMGVEVDAMPGGFVCSASCKGVIGTTDVWEAVHGRRAIRKLFTKEQRAFYAEHAPAGLELDDLSILGPIFVLKVRFSPPTGRKHVAELWLYPDGSRVLELSTKCMPDETFQVAAESRAHLASLGVPLSGEQATKTRKALEIFSARLAAG